MIHLRHTAAALTAVALIGLLTGCTHGADDLLTPPVSASPTVAVDPTTPSPEPTPVVRLAKTPGTQRGEVARTEFRQSKRSGHARSVAGPADVSGHGQALYGACVDAQPGGLTYRVLDASGTDDDDSLGDDSTGDRTLATGQLPCDGRIHEEQLDLGGRGNPVQLSVVGGTDNDVARGWLIITNRAVDLH